MLKRYKGYIWTCACGVESITTPMGGVPRGPYRTHEEATAAAEQHLVDQPVRHEIWAHEQRRDEYFPPFHVEWIDEYLDPDVPEVQIFG